MTLCEKLVYLADYIDLSRTFENCVKLRSFFFDAAPEAMDEAARLAHLRDTLILSYDMTISDLLSEGTPISPDTFEARNELVTERASIQR
jgi:HD superfamily phosphohydrolase YqeK